MSMHKKTLGLMIILFIISACGAPAAVPDPSSVETIVAATLQAATQMAPTAAPIINGLSINIDGLSLTIPTGLANGMTVTNETAVPPASDMPWWGIYPAHKIYPLQGYQLANTFHEAKVYVYPAGEYAAMNEDVAAKIQSLKDILSNPSQPLPERLPFLPTWNAGEEFHSNVQIVSFQNGSGIRYLTQYGQFPSPVSNESMFYTFQGLSSDGTYYVSVILPISAPFLVARSSPDSPVPAYGIPFDWDNIANAEAHFNAVTEKLNAADPAIFNPTLPTLDALVQSILIQ